MSVLVTENATKYYGERIGVDGLTLSIDAGTIFGFLGPNGSGKTTTIRMLLGFLRPTRGKASLFGLDCWSNSHQVKAEVGYVPGDLRLYPWMTLKNGLDLIGRIRKREIKSAGYELAEQFALDPELRVRKMSRGTRQKLGLILALAHRPKALILDEPTSALDPPMQEAFYQILRERANDGSTVFFSSHTLGEIETLCDRVGILRAGKLVEDEKLEVLRNRAARIVKLCWSDDAVPSASELPEALKLVSEAGSVWKCALVGDLKPMLAWASTQKLADMTISPPDLDGLFREYYQESDAER